MQHITNTELLIIRHLKRYGYDPKSTKYQTLKKLVGMNYALYACHVNEDAIFNCLFDIIEKFDLLPHSKKGKNICDFFIYQYTFEPDFESQWERWIYRCATTIRLTNVDKFPRYPKPLFFKNWELKTNL
jgi:hypothetical protein